MEVILVVDNQLEWNYVRLITEIKGKVKAGACLGVNEQTQGGWMTQESADALQ